VLIKVLYICRYVHVSSIYYNNNGIAVPDHIHVTIGEDKTLEHMSAVTNQQRKYRNVLL